jgi:hypothetical protein
MREFISVVDTAKIVRKTLKSVFPGVKFSVRCRKYSGGASIDVTWTNGPELDRVEGVTKNFEGSKFDGMTDSTRYVVSTYEDKEVYFGANYIFCYRIVE